MNRWSPEPTVSTPGNVSLCTLSSRTTEGRKTKQTNKKTTSDLTLNVVKVQTFS